MGVRVGDNGWAEVTGGEEGVETVLQIQNKQKKK